MTTPPSLPRPRTSTSGSPAATDVGRSVLAGPDQGQDRTGTAGHDRARARARAGRAVDVARARVGLCAQRLRAQQHAGQRLCGQRLAQPLTGSSLTGSSSTGSSSTSSSSTSSSSTNSGVPGGSSRSGRRPLCRDGCCAACRSRSGPAPGSVKGELAAHQVVRDQRDGSRDLRIEAVVDLPPCAHGGECIEDVRQGELRAVEIAHGTALRHRRNPRLQRRRRKDLERVQIMSEPSGDARVGRGVDRGIRRVRGAVAGGDGNHSGGCGHREGRGREQEPTRAARAVDGGRRRRRARGDHLRGPGVAGCRGRSASRAVLRRRSRTGDRPVRAPSSPTSSSRHAGSIQAGMFGCAVQTDRPRRQRRSPGNATAPVRHSSSTSPSE